MASNILEKIVTYDVRSKFLEGKTLSSFQVGKLVVAQAKPLAPVNKIIGKGGNLRNSIMAKSANSRIDGFNDSQGDKATEKLKDIPPKGSAYVGSAVDYAIHQEFGTKRMQAQPFLRPAIDLVAKGNETKDVIKKYFGGELEKGAKEVKSTKVKKL